MGNYISIGRVALMIDVSHSTIIRWYKWYEDDSYPKPEELVLPEYIYVDRKMTKFFNKDDIPKLEEFKNLIRNKYSGAMAEFNAKTAWGNRGSVILERKRVKEDESKNSVSE